MLKTTNRVFSPCRHLGSGDRTTALAVAFSDGLARHLGHLAPTTTAGNAGFGGRRPRGHQKWSMRRRLGRSTQLPTRSRRSAQTSTIQWPLTNSLLCLVDEVVDLRPPPSKSVTAEPLMWPPPIVITHSNRCRQRWRPLQGRLGRALQRPVQPKAAELDA